MKNTIPLKFSTTLFSGKIVALLMLFMVSSGGIFCQKKPAGENTPVAAIRGADISFYPETRQFGTRFLDGSGREQPLPGLLKAAGINTVRVRLWNNPQNGHCSFQEVAAFAKTLHENGLAFWLDFHYSDDWADPGKQYKPAAWAKSDAPALADSVFQFTKQCLEVLVAQQTPPAYVQVGNEINNGMLWPEGKIWTGSVANWQGVIALLKAGCKAVRQTCPSAKIMLHYAGYKDANYFFANIGQPVLDYDLIGLSYYPWWHGNNLDSLSLVMKQLRATHSKPVMIAETAYPWTLNWSDNTGNILGLASQLHPNYPATPAGQAAFLRDLGKLALQASPDPEGGVCYWAPEFVTFRGKTATDGTPWENLTLFDFDYRALPGLESLGKITR